MPDAIDVGVLVAAARPDHEALRTLARHIAAEAAACLEGSTHRTWRFEVLPATRLDGDRPRRPSEFLDEAALRMVEGPFDIMFVVTDVPVLSRRTVAPGMASPVARLAVISAWKLRSAGRGRTELDLDDPALRANAVTLALHLVGHIAGVPKRASDDALAPWHFEPDLESPRPISPASAELLRRRSDGLISRAAETRSSLRLLAFHVASAARHPALLWRPIARSRAPLLPFFLPRLSTTAVLPVLVLVFTAEIWDVGVNLGDGAAVGLALLAVVGAAAYIVFVTDLLFPRKERHHMTEHLAVVNVAVVLIVLLAMAGLLVLLVLLVAGIAFFVFPEGLIRTWPTLGGPDVDTIDRWRLCLFVASIGTLTGALGAGLESRIVLRHLALFREDV